MNKIRPLYIYICLTFIILAGVGLFVLKPITAAAATEVASGTCGTKLTWSYTSDKTLTITGSGAMKSMYETTIPWRTYCPSIKNVVFVPGEGGGITTISSYAFYKCSSLESIDIPDSVTSIGSYVFSECSSLTSVTIPDSVETIGGGTFSDCLKLSDVKLSSQSKLKLISSSLFSRCYALRTITLPDNITSIGSYAFNACPLTSITIPAGVTSIGGYAFWGCDFDSIVIPENVESIGDQAFYQCKSLTSIIIPANVTSIGNKLFGNCYVLKTVTIANGSKLTSIGTDLFNSFCTKLEIIMYPSVLESQMKAAISTSKPAQVLYEVKAESSDTVTITKIIPISNAEKVSIKDVMEGYTIDSVVSKYRKYVIQHGSDDQHTFKEGELGKCVICEPDFNEYTITYSKGSFGNGNDIPEDTKTEGENLTLSYQTFTRAGYTQKGWSTNSDGSTNNYALGGTYTDDADITLYPYWEADKYQVTFNANSGSWSDGTTKTVEQTYDSAWDIPSPNPTREGYEFVGWYTNYPNGKVDSTTTVNITAAQTINAVWRETFGGESGTIKIETTYGVPVEKDLDEYIQYYSGTKSSGDFTYSGSVPSGVSISASKLKVSDKVSVNTYNFKITAKEKNPKIATLSVDSFGTSDITLNVQIIVNEAAAGFVSKPEGKTNLVYDGTAQDLLTGGTTNDGKWVYSTDGENGDYSDEIPKGRDAGDYEIWCKVEGDANHSDTDPEKITVTIEPAELREGTDYTIPTGLTAVYGDTLADVEGDMKGFVWVAPSTNVGNVGTNSFPATYSHPAEPNNYETVETDLDVVVSKASGIVPNVTIDYENETVSTTDDMEYSTDGGNTWYPCDEDMSLEDLGWDGSGDMDVQFRYVENDNHTAGDPRELTIPSRPAAPGNIQADVTATTITVTTPDDRTGEYEFSIDGEHWSDSGTFSGLAPETTYPVQVRRKATSSSFKSDIAAKDFTTDKEGSSEQDPGDNGDANYPYEPDIPNNGQGNNNGQDQGNNGQDQGNNEQDNNNGQDQGSGEGSGGGTGFYPEYPGYPRYPGYLPPYLLDIYNSSDTDDVSSAENDNNEDEILNDTGFNGGDDVSAAAGTYEAGEMLEDTAASPLMIVTIGLILAFVIKKRSKVSK